MDSGLRRNDIVGDAGSKPFKSERFALAPPLQPTFACRALVGRAQVL